MTSQTFFFFFIPVLSFLLLAVNLIFASHNPYQEKDSVFECGFHSFLGQNRTQFSISFFIFALLFLLFDLEILLVYPYIVSSYTNSIYGLIIMLIFFLVLTLGFAYELGKNALNIDSRQMFTVVKSTSNISAISTSIIKSCPKPHAFVSLELQSSFFNWDGYIRKLKSDFSLKNTFILIVSLTIAFFIKNWVVLHFNLDLKQYTQYIAVAWLGVFIKSIIKGFFDNVDTAVQNKFISFYNLFKSVFYQKITLNKFISFYNLFKSVFYQKITLGGMDKPLQVDLKVDKPNAHFSSSGRDPRMSIGGILGKENRTNGAQIGANADFSSSGRDPRMSLGGILNKENPANNAQVGANVSNNLNSVAQPFSNLPPPDVFTDTPSSVYYYKYVSGDKTSYKLYLWNVFHDRPINLYIKETPMQYTRAKFTFSHTEPSKRLNTENLYVQKGKGQDLVKYDPGVSHHTNKELYTKDHNGKIISAYPQNPGLKTPSHRVKISRYESE